MPRILKPHTTLFYPTLQHTNSIYSIFIRRKGHPDTKPGTQTTASVRIVIEKEHPESSPWRPLSDHRNRIRRDCVTAVRIAASVAGT
jgi:hypothetical protein